MFPNVRQRSKDGEYVEKTIEAKILTGIQESSRGGIQPVCKSDQFEAATTKDGKGKTVETRECDTNDDTRVE